MGGLTAAIFVATGASDLTIGEFASRMIWDPTNKKIQYSGTSHTGGSPLAGSGGLATWDDATNQWTRETYTWNSDAEGHGYQHMTRDLLGNLYRRHTNSRTIKRREYGDTGEASWETGHVADITGNYANQFAGGLEWFPELNGGSGGLVFVDSLGAKYTNAALSSWTDADAAGGDHDQNIAYFGGNVYFGGSSDGDLNLYRMGPTGTITAMADLPFPANTNVGDGMMIAAPNNNGLFLLEAASNGDFRFFNGTSWSDLGSHQFQNDEYFLPVPISTYGVILGVTIDSSGVATPAAKVYKQ